MGVRVRSDPRFPDSMSIVDHAGGGIGLGNQLTGIVDEVFGHFSQGSALFAKVNDDPTATSLSLFDSFLNSKDQIRSTSADVRAEYITTVAFVVHTKGQSNVGI